MKAIDCLAHLLNKLSPLSVVADWPLRLSLAATFFFHGLDKINNFSASAMKFGISEPVWALVAFAEVGGAAAIIIGRLGHAPWQKVVSRLGFAAFIPVMLGAITMVHWPIWAFHQNGMEFQVLVLSIALYGLITDCHRDT